ncbi:hypothetical protein K1I93_09370, partial [Streptococcus australis]|nr:hypothetical protein [Streptococcus australis]
MTTNGKNGKTLKDRYQKDGDNHFQLREDCWTANRATIWEAITCKADGSYFHATCSDGGDSQGPSVAQNQCRCSDKPNAGKGSGNGDVNIVPTYFDYVPQYLRWFEEWAEDFCRKRKHKLENAIKNCRNDKTQKYCSGNGHDCKETVRGNEHFVEGECHDCSVACSPFVKWLDNQKLEFLKQREKDTKEMQKYTNGAVGRSGSGRKKWDASNNYEGYESKFYNILKERGYGTVGEFLEKLSKEKDCENIKDTEGGKIDFAKVSGSTTASDKNSYDDDSNKTFSHTEYCETCPWCATKEKKDGEWKDKDPETQCTDEQSTPFDDK